jgi:hypothetical protein
MIRSLGASATYRRRPPRVAAEERERLARWLPSGVELQPLAVSKPSRMNHLEARSHRAPATGSVSLHIRGWIGAALSAEDHGGCDASVMDDLKISPFSSIAVECRWCRAPLHATMAGQREKKQHQSPSALEKKMVLLI